MVWIVKALSSSVGLEMVDEVVKSTGVSTAEDPTRIAPMENAHVIST